RFGDTRGGDARMLELPGSRHSREHKVTQGTVPSTEVDAADANAASSVRGLHNGSRRLARVPEGHGNDEPNDTTTGSKLTRSTSRDWSLRDFELLAIFPLSSTVLYSPNAFLPPNAHPRTPTP
ncbi:hypothetical protein B0A48_13748, partial [Cryoendolithus antarcticus]